MTKQTTFPTVPLDQIQHLIPQAERSDADTSNAMLCQNCGHPASDHNINNETCWHINQQDGTVTICNCQGWLSDEADKATAS